MASADRVTLYGLMVKPIQRFPQFILLLQVRAGGSCTHLPLHPIFRSLDALANILARGMFFGWHLGTIPRITFQASILEVLQALLIVASPTGLMWGFFGVSFVPHPRTC